MNELYPLKFIPILKEKIWGGSKLHEILGKKQASTKCGESWEISGVQDNISIVSNGFLEGNNLQELIEVYMGDIVGDKIYEKYGHEFPLLIKFIEASDDLSIQVHPDDKLARERHFAYGKTEMWYIIDAAKNAKLISGFNRKINKEEFIQHLISGEILEILNSNPVKKGDVFFIPAGTIHAIGAGVLLTEIQQTSDITYRIYDYNRKTEDGTPRELHTELALDAIKFSFPDKSKTEYEKKLNETRTVVQSAFFTTNRIHFDATVIKDYILIDSFVIYICTEGEVEIVPENQTPVTLLRGETLLVPAIINQLKIIPRRESVLLETYISGN